MPHTVYDYIKLVFPESTVPNEEGTGVDVTEPGRWSVAPPIPTDLFAISAMLLDTSSAFSHFDPDPDGAIDSDENPWFSLKKKDRETCEILGQKWIKLHGSLDTIATPTEVEQLWADLLKESAEPIRLPLRNRATPKWWTIALKLLIIADEASSRVGAPEAADDPYFKKAIDHKQVRHGNYELSENTNWSGSMAYLRSHGSAGTFAFQADPNVVNIFPKTRISVAGCSHRNFSRNLTMLPKVGAARCHWHMPPKQLLEDDDMPVDILVIPFPFEVKAKSFKPTHVAKESLPGGNKSDTRPHWGNFELQQDWLDEEDIVDLSLRLMMSAKQDVETVNVVMFPECSLDFDTFGRVCWELKKLEPALEFVIAGSSDNCDPETDGPGNYAMTAVWHDFGEGPRAVISSRKKHHRWMLSANQLETYALTSTLDPRANWWETHNIGQCELHFHPFRKSSLFSAMICEDLARSEPCHEVLRSVAPNLVFVLLMDGPQIAERWSARYASTLSDDPGSSVLTLTCFGLVERSNQTQMFKRQEAVAYFSSPFGQTPIYLPYKDGARGVLITLTSMMELGQQTIDGRVSDDSRAWKLTSTQPVKPLEKSRSKPSKLAKRLSKRRKKANRKIPSN
ncbi:hypothetical protein KO498_09200 [Lentibacter algarum]|uniref:hypothetical protein n=1 Tax=Lentibacter algarum TaxID=576131 RepID=UPI001C075CC5|nr:hypothetical protein [Lentibacter algarum]MBU2981989.1 hypothetical protein [Lentibacter algarum]